MAIRKSTDIANETDSRYNKVKDAKSISKITKRFDADTHNPYPGDEALQYLAKKIDDVIDETNKGTTASGSYAGDIKILKAASGSFSTRVTLNDAKTPLVVGTQAGNAKAGNTTTISSAQAVSIAAGATIQNKTSGTLTFGLDGNNLIITSLVGRTSRTYTINPN